MREADDNEEGESKTDLNEDRKHCSYIKWEAEKDEWVRERRQGMCNLSDLLKTHF